MIIWDIWDFWEWPTPLLLTYGQTSREFLRQTSLTDLLLRDFDVIRDARNRQSVLFKLVLDDGGARVSVTRLADGTHVHKYLYVRFDRLFADIIDERQFRSAINSDQR